MKSDQCSTRLRGKGGDLSRLRTTEDEDAKERHTYRLLESSLCTSKNGIMRLKYTYCREKGERRPAVLFSPIPLSTHTLSDEAAQGGRGITQPGVGWANRRETQGDYNYCVFISPAFLSPHLFSPGSASASSPPYGSPTAGQRSPSIHSRGRLNNTFGVISAHGNRHRRMRGNACAIICVVSGVQMFL